MKIQQLTFTRFIAAIAIVIFHFGLRVAPFNNESIKFLFERANIGVSYFFVLSGFIMVIAYHQFAPINPLDYFRNRFARIYPLVFLSVLPFFAALFFFQGKANLQSVLQSFFLIQAWFPGNVISGNFPLWSLTVELFFYAFFPLVLNKVYKRFSLKSIGFVVFVIWCITIIVQHVFLYSLAYKCTDESCYELIFYLPPMHLNQFLIGNLAGLLVVNRGVNSGRNLDIPVIIPISIIVLFLKYTSQINFHDGFLAWFFAALIVLLSLNTGVITKVFSLKPLIFLGEISFAIYVLQFPVFKITSILIEKLHLTSNNTIIFYSCLMVLLLVSTACHLLIELPLRNKIKAIKLK